MGGVIFKYLSTKPLRLPPLAGFSHAIATAKDVSTHRTDRMDIDRLIGSHVAERLREGFCFELVMVVVV